MVERVHDEAGHEPVDTEKLGTYTTGELFDAALRTARQGSDQEAILLELKARAEVDGTLDYRTVDSD